MKAYQEYLTKLIGILENIRDSQDEKFDQAAQIIAAALSKKQMVHFWGPGGHSSIFAEDVLYREGELALINPILDPSICLVNGAMKEIEYYERIPEIGRAVIKSNRVAPGDVVVMGSAYGVNPVCIEGAVAAKEAGATLIAITSHFFSDALDNEDTRHETGASLAGIADVYISSFSPFDDLLLEREGFPQKFGPVGTILQLATLKALTVSAIEILIESGEEVPIWRNALERGGAKFNETYMKQAWSTVKAL